MQFAIGLLLSPSDMIRHIKGWQSKACSRVAGVFTNRALLNANQEPVCA